jgi:hypothetical protein
MPNPFTPAPITQLLPNNVRQSTDWTGWFTQIYSYITGFFTESDSDQELQMNVTYIASAPTLQTYTVPSSFGQNQFIRVVGSGAGGWTIQLNPGQTIHGDGTTTSGGSLSSTDRYDSVWLVSTVSGTELAIVSKVGTLTYA